MRACALASRSRSSSSWIPPSAARSSWSVPRAFSMSVSPPSALMRPASTCSIVASATKSRYLSWITCTSRSCSVWLYVRSSLRIVCTSCPYVREHRNASTSNTGSFSGDSSARPRSSGGGSASAGTTPTSSIVWRKVFTLWGGPQWAECVAALVLFASHVGDEAKEACRDPVLPEAVPWLDDAPKYKVMVHKVVAVVVGWVSENTYRQSPLGSRRSWAVPGVRGGACRAKRAGTRTRSKSCWCGSAAGGARAFRRRR